jgi:hypothetical protein
MHTPPRQPALSRDIAELPDSAPLLPDPPRLRERWREDGVLFFRNVISHSAIARVREEYLARLKEVGVVDSHASEPTWNGRNRLDGTLAKPIGDEVWRGLVADPSIDRVVRTFLGEAPNWVPIVVHRTAPPAPAGDPAAANADVFATRHQDGIYNYGIDFITCWVPLMDIDEQVGGLAVVPGSHKGSLYPADAFKNPDQRVGIPAGAIPDAAWRRPDYKIGDLLMFHSMTAHAGLANRSDKLRLSMDIRFLPASMAKPLIGKVISTDDTVVELAEESGAERAVTIDERTVVRGPKGTPVFGADRGGIVFPGAEVIVMPDDRGHAKLVRSVSRKYVDLPATWYETLPAGWVK